MFQLAGGLMWFGFGIAAAIGVSESDNPLDDYLEALSGARGVVAVWCVGGTQGGGRSVSCHAHLVPCMCSTARPAAPATHAIP